MPIAAGIWDDRQRKWVFTMPNTAVKCGGAPQKIMYLADDYFRKSDARKNGKVIFTTGQGALFSVDKYRKTLEKVVARKEIDLRLKHNLIELKPDTKEVCVLSACVACTA